MDQTPLLVALAKVYEEKYNPPKPTKSTNSNSNYPNRAPFNPTKTNINQYNAKTNTTPIMQTPPTRPMHQDQKNPNVKRISPVEMQVRKEKGLCYLCDDKFSFSHKCPNKHLMLLQIDDEQEVEEEDKPPDSDHLASEVQIEEHNLSLNAMKGSHGVGTLQFQGRIGNICGNIGGWRELKQFLTT